MCDLCRAIGIPDGNRICVLCLRNGVITHADADTEQGQNALIRHLFEVHPIESAYLLVVSEMPNDTYPPSN